MFLNDNLDFFGKKKFLKVFKLSFIFLLKSKIFDLYFLYYCLMCVSRYSNLFI